MLTSKCCYCADGYNHRKDAPCNKCKNNPYDSVRQSNMRYDYFVQGDKQEMNVYEQEVWK